MDIAQIVSNVGFPIFAFILMYKMTQDLQKAHSEEVGKMTSAIEANTLAITTLNERLENSNDKAGA